MNVCFRRGTVAAASAVVTAFACIGLVAASARAQAPAVPAVRHLGPRLGLSTDSLGTTIGIRAFADGRVLVNDVLSRRLIMFDSTLKHPTVVADSTPSTNKAYGTPFGGIIAYKSDSTFFVDPTSISLVVLDPNGKPAHVISPPRPSDIASLLNLGTGGAAFDGHDALIYRAGGGRPQVTGNVPGMAAPAAPAAPTPQTGIPAHDSAAIIRANITSHVVDTLGFLKMAITQPLQMNQGADGTMMLTVTVYPVSSTDDWAMVSDGSIAIVRASDYHIDWINADGTRATTPKIAHEWKRLTDSVKEQVLDSTHHVIDSIQTLAEKQIAAAKTSGRGIPAGMNIKVLVTGPELSDIPDYMPPFSAGAVKADFEDNLWIREGVALSSSAVPTYDIVNRNGQLVDRVELPPSLTLVGFGPGVVYLTSREGSGTVLVKYRVR